MSSRKTERLLNLVICLLATRRFLPIDAIRRAVPGYDAENDEAFRRMFERDKEELRALGVPLQTGTDSVWDDEVGYRIARRDYELPAVELTPDEAAAVGVATRLWSSAQLAEPAAAALLKLRAAGVELADPGPAFTPGVAADEAALGPLLDALRDRRAVTFAHRTGGTGPAETREVEPWGVLAWHGRWYVAGRDRDRQAPRVFRLDRIAGAVSAVGPPGAVSVPPEVDVRAMVAALSEPAGEGSAVVLVRPGAGHALRRMATAVRRRDDARDELTIPCPDVGRLAELVAEHGAAALAVDPPALRNAVVARLTAVAG